MSGKTQQNEGGSKATQSTEKAAPGSEAEQVAVAAVVRALTVDPHDEAVRSRVGCLQAAAQCLQGDRNGDRLLELAERLYDWASDPLACFEREKIGPINPASELVGSERDVKRYAGMNQPGD